MKKILGLDMGERRIGVAIAENNLVATWGVIENKNLNEAVHELSRLVRREQIENIVIGLPHFRDSLQADKIHAFALELKKNLDVEVVFVDETLTSKDAERVLKDSSLNPRSGRYKEEVDKLAAKMILEQYLNVAQKK
ncbi:MAG TPA: Holliday junction resolvase RuvX [Patescibacteria group bacterium]|nr:Holliday junction resolvase RuvX [Patescibacteria group bacterium]